jgi:hypothetical protein
MTKKQNAVNIGGGIAGKLAAQFLSDYYVRSKESLNSKS